MITRTFVPDKSLPAKLREYLLDGYAVKADGGATNLMCIIPRDQLKHPEATNKQMSNLAGKTEIPGAVMLPRADIASVLDRLRQEGYTLLREACSSGGCQYHTTIKYIAGEMVDIHDKQSARKKIIDGLTKKYRDSDVCAAEFLAGETVPLGMTYEESFEIYVAMMKKIEWDEFYVIKEGQTIQL